MMDGDHLICVAPADVKMVWPMVEHLIDAAYEALDEPTPDVLPWLVEKKGLLWVLMRGSKIIAASTTSLIQGRSGLACRVVTVGGEQVDWKECIGKIECYAKAEGCYKVCIDGRGGWTRILPNYDPKCVSYEKRI